MQTRVNTAKQTVFGKKKQWRCLIFWECGFEHFPRDVHEFVNMLAWDPDGKCCHGPD